MTDKPEKIVVTQEDREAAADQWAMLFCDEDASPAVGAAIRSGVADETPGVQAFARHRIAAEHRAWERAAEVCEEYAKEIEGFHNVAPGFVREAATHIRKLAGGTDD